MKLSASTLGCPTWTLDEILTRFKAYGYDAVELRGIGEDLDLTHTPEFASAASLYKTQRKFRDAGLEVSAIDSSAKFANRDETPQNLEMARQAIDLAVALGARFVRVFGGGIPDSVPRASGVRQVAESLMLLGDYALANGGVNIVLETHDSFSTGAQVAEVLSLTSHPCVAALWDIHHPFRHNEKPSETMGLIGRNIRFTHVKDSRPDDTYCLLGDGDIPVRECLQELKTLGYGGYVSVEWEKRWIPALAEPEVALPQYARKLREYLAEL